MTLSVSNVTLPMLLRQRTIKRRERVELFKDMYELTVARWLPIGVLASLLYFAAAYFAPARSGRHAKSVLFVAGAAMISIGPCTLLFVMEHVMEHVTKLKGYLELADSAFPSNEEVLAALRRWGHMHVTRTVCVGAACALGLYNLAAQQGGVYRLAVRWMRRNDTRGALRGACA